MKVETFCLLDPEDGEGKKYTIPEPRKDNIIKQGKVNYFQTSY